MVGVIIAKQEKNKNFLHNNYKIFKPILHFKQYGNCSDHWIKSFKNYTGYTLSFFWIG